MFTPTPRAIWLMVVGMPVFLVLAVLAPNLWIVSGGWMAGVLGLLLLDALVSARLSAFRTEIGPPTILYIDSEDEVDLTFSFEKGPVPARMSIRLEVDAHLEELPEKQLKGFDGRTRPFSYTLKPIRRGDAVLQFLWARWQGPLGLIEKRTRQTLDISIPITPNTRWVKEEAIRLYARDAEFGLKHQLERGEGSEFDALREFTSGMDRRAIDWKHSARHRILLAKEYRTERNHNIVFAFDTGRLMSEPLRGIPKLDRAINAALLLSYVSLRSGDKTMIFGFDARPNVASGLLHGKKAFPKIQALASQLDYSTEEANYTLALTDLAARLERRSLIVLFTDFVDTISAELMLENVKRLLDRHLVVFATFEEEALKAFIDAAPNSSEDISRAVIADTLLQERETVFLKLQRLGAQIIETQPDQFGSSLVSKYLSIKRRDML